MDFQTIKDPDARELVTLLDRVKDDWSGRKKGQDWSAVVMTVAKAYPPDTHAIIELFSDKPAPKPAGKSRDATPPPPGAPGASVAVDCDSCPETTANAVGAGRDTVVQPDTTHLQTKAGVLKAYGEDVDDLIVVAKGLGVNVGNSGKVNTIAGKIAYHFRVKAGKV